MKKRYTVWAVFRGNDLFSVHTERVVADASRIRADLIKDNAENLADVVRIADLSKRDADGWMER